MVFWSGVFQLKCGAKKVADDHLSYHRFDGRKKVLRSPCYHSVSNGLRRPRCDRSVKNIPVHRRIRAPVLYCGCFCGWVFNAFAGTDWQETHHPCSTIIRILQGIAQKAPTNHLANELDMDPIHLLEHRRKASCSVSISQIRQVRLSGSFFSKTVEIVERLLVNTRIFTLPGTGDV